MYDAGWWWWYRRRAVTEILKKIYIHIHTYTGLSIYEMIIKTYNLSAMPWLLKWVSLYKKSRWKKNWLERELAIKPKIRLIWNLQQQQLSQEP